MGAQYRQLGRDDRETISRLTDARIPVRRIAAELGRHPSTIYRELRRNFMHDEEPFFRGYFPNVAQKYAADRRAPGRKLVRDPELAAKVIDGLRKSWSPEQIAGRLRHSGSRRVCHETIYRYVYGEEGKRQAFYQLLPWSRRRRRPRGGRKPRGLQIPHTSCIGQRPSSISQRTDFGHWEGDLVIFRKQFGKSNLTSVVERKSRFVMLWRNPSRTSAGVMAGIEAKLAPLPSSLRQSITFDRGTEFAAYGTLRSRMGMDSYFCEPRSPWQKGGVENLNGRLRRFLPLDVDIAALPVDAIEAVSARLNDTPRKCLEYRTPREVLAETMAVHGAKDDGSSGVGLAPPRMKW